MANNNLSLLHFVLFLLLNNYFTETVVIKEIRGNLPHPSVVVRIFNEFLKPMMRSLPLNEAMFKTHNETDIDRVIREKVDDLHPLLQDNDVILEKENIMLEGKDDTTIIEFLPKTDDRKKKVIEDDSFKSHLKKYKKIREKINKALKTESVSEKTKNFVIKTLDDLIRSLLGSRCKWKRNLRAERNENPSYLATKWNNGLQEIKEMLLNFMKAKSTNSRRHHDISTFFDAIQILFRSVSEDVDTISKKYKILCDFVPKYENSGIKYSETTSSALRNNWDKTDLEDDRCQNVVVCSNELKDFMQNFYQTLNDTTVSVIRNYAEMYSRDVNVDNETEKGVVISLLYKIINGLEENITRIFTEETQNFNLDKEKNQHGNIKALSNYIKNTVEHVNEVAKRLIKTQLPTLREKILSIIIDDLNVNLDVDLGNLEREFVRKICVIFHLCNGKYRGRRQGLYNNNKNNLYVQVQLTLDDDMTNIRSYRKLMKTVTARTNTVNRFSFMTNVTVTRTTLI